MRSQLQSSSAIRAIFAAALAVLAEGAASAADWRVNETTSALTGAADVSASLDSARPLLNMLNVPQPASLVIRCSGGQLAAYVVWPQVLSIGANKELINTPQTMVSWRIDNADIRVNFWDRSDEGVAAGKFSTGGAVKILRLLSGARKLVVEMTGTITQDAVFDLGDVNQVIAKVEQACRIAGANDVGGVRGGTSAASSINATDQTSPVTFNGAADAAAKGGFGITFATFPQGIILTAVAPGSRAERGRLRPGQVVTAIDGNSIAGMGLSDVVTKLKMATGTTVFTVTGLGNLIINQ